jgi:flagellar basal-body rod protein FlgF
MDAGLVTSMSGALAQSKRVEVIANNLANADTAGFKADGLAFEEAMMSAHQVDTRSDIPERPYTESELLSRAGDERRVVLYGREFTDMRTGAFRETGNSLDIAVEGNGFLEVLTPNGVRLTRAGNLTLDASGRLTTRDGFPILSAGGGAAARAPAQATATATTNPAVPAQPDPAIAAQAGRAITLGTPDVVIGQDGSIFRRAPDGGEGQIVGQLSLVQVRDPSALKKDGRNLFSAPPEALVTAGAPAAANRNPAAAAGAGNPAAGATPEIKPNPLGSTLIAPRVHQGVIEASNVNPVAQMTQLIEAQRMFESNTKLMQTHADATGRLSEIGKY